MSSALPPAGALRPAAAFLLLVLLHAWPAVAQAATDSAPTLSLPAEPSAGRVAVCFFGQVKNFTHVLPLIEEHIFGPLRAAGYAYDVYAHTYLLASISNPRNGEHDEPIEAHSLELELPDARVVYSGAEDIDSLYKLEHLLVNGDAWHNEGNSLHFWLRQLYSLNRLTLLWAPHQDKYRFVLYLRPDVAFRTPLDLPQLADELDDDTIAVPEFHQYGGYNDRLAFGRPGPMIKYGLRMALMWHYVLTLHYKPHAERFLYHVTLEERLRVIWSSMCFERVRATARNARTDDCNNPTMLTVSNDFEKGPMLGNRPVKKQDKAGEGANQGRRARLRSRGSM